MKSNVTSHTRAGRAGRAIICPHCQQAVVVFHFAWSAIMCSGCRAPVDKVDWRTDEPMPLPRSRAHENDEECAGREEAEEREFAYRKDEDYSVVDNNRRQWPARRTAMAKNKIRFRGLSDDQSRYSVLGEINGFMGSYDTQDEALDYARELAATDASQIVYVVRLLTTNDPSQWRKETKKAKKKSRPLGYTVRRGNEGGDERPLCAVVDCAAEGKARVCPADGGRHHHGRIHYNHCGNHGLTFRANGWHLICDEHYAACVEARGALEVSP